jgi:hydroxysqualene synthase
VVSARPAAHGTDLERAYRLCAQIARRHYENFPVASLLLPRRMRPAIAAIYAFARRADDFADEPGPSDRERLRSLDDWHQRLVGQVPNSADPDGLIFLALHDAIRRHGLPVVLFEDLLSAFRQDVSTRRYATWAQVLDYCRRSANPVGRLVLRVAGHDDPVLDGRSDAICTALQLTNFWQDFGVDWRRGRLYLPVEDRDRAGADERDLNAGRWTAEWRRATNDVVARTRELFGRGRPLCDAVQGRLRWELRMTWLGGSRVLDEVEGCADLLNHRPQLGRRDLSVLIGQALAWRSGPL